MRIKTYQALCTISISMLLILSCQKQAANPAFEPGKPYQFLNGIVTFSSFDGYRSFLESEKQKDAFLSDVVKSDSYISWAESHKNIDLSFASVSARTADPNEDIEDILSSPMLSGMVNENGIVQIGSYLFKLDYDSSRVYVINIANRESSYQKLLTKDGTGTDVFVFSTDDDILDILEDNKLPVSEVYDGESASLFKRCKEYGARERKRKGVESGVYSNCKPSDYRDYGKMWLKVVYQKAGFYFSLHLKSTLEYWRFNGSGVQLQQNAINGANSYIRYKPKCRDEVGPYTEDAEITGAILSRRPYESGRGLTKFHYKVQFRYKGDTNFGQLPGTYFYPELYEIIYGY